MLRHPARARVAIALGFFFAPSFSSSCLAQGSAVYLAPAAPAPGTYYILVPNGATPPPGAVAAAPDRALARASFTQEAVPPPPSPSLPQARPAGAQGATIPTPTSLGGAGATGPQNPAPPPPAVDSGPAAKLLSRRQKDYQSLHTRVYHIDQDLQPTVPDKDKRRAEVVKAALPYYALGVDRENVRTITVADLDPKQQEEFNKIIDEAMAPGAKADGEIAPENPLANSGSAGATGGQPGRPAGTSGGGQVIHILVPNGTTPTTTTAPLVQTGTPVLLFVPVKHHHLFFRRW